MQTPDFLEVKDILEIHDLLIDQLGGTLGIRDRGLLESALAQPQASLENFYIQQSRPRQLHTCITFLKTTHFWMETSGLPMVQWRLFCA